jgi:adenylylsulfate kinase
MPQSTGFTLWLTGMSGAGKTTLAHHLGARFRAIGRNAEILDHDDVAPHLDLTKEIGASKDDRKRTTERLGYLAKLLCRNDCIAITASVSPYREPRDKIRKEIGRFVEVFVDCPTEQLMARDTKGLYKKALAGELPNFIGVTDPYETPQHAEVTVRSDVETVDACAERVVRTLVDIGYLKPEEAKAMLGKRIRPTSAKSKGRERKPAKATKTQPKAKQAARSATKAKSRPTAKSRPAKRDSPHKKSSKKAARG